jgi:glycosyltransferase 2 family protein
VVRVLDGIDAFLTQLTSVHPFPLFLAILAHLTRLACTSTAWRNVLAAAYPETRVRRVPIFGAYLAGVGVNAVIPIRAGDAVRVVLAHRSIPGSTYTTVVSSSFVLMMFDLVAASLLLTWAFTQNAFPPVGRVPHLRTFDFAWLFDRPTLAESVIGGLIIVLGLFLFWAKDHIANFWGRVRQAFTVVRTPRRYLRTVVLWQCLDWSFRLLTIWLLLDAFGIPQTVRNALLVQVSASVATTLPLTPAGIGTEQAFLLYVFRGAVASSKLLAFSVGMKLTIISTNAIAGFAAIFFTLKTIRYSKALEAAPQKEG